MTAQHQLSHTAFIMCGIAGFFGQGTCADLTRMLDVIQHRGPDGRGEYQDRRMPLFLGHQRLAVLDLLGGTQPLWTTDQAFGIVFNGEIYNHAELRQQLESLGHHFLTDHSDTEALLHAYREWGSECVHRLNGMWAFAIYDRPQQRLFLSRDRMGKKPLYWFQSSQTFAFASELTALLAHPECPRSISQSALQKFFGYGWIPAPLSLIAGVQKLPAGHHLFFQLQLKAKLHPQHSAQPQEIVGLMEPRVVQYWDFVLEPHDLDQVRDTKEDSLNAAVATSAAVSSSIVSTSPSSSLRQLEEELLFLLRQAVQRRLIADVPIGVFLSGGLDSSLITALAAQSLPAHQLKTFSIGFTNASFNELPFVETVAQALGVQSDTEILTDHTFTESVSAILVNLDEPQGDSSIIPTWLLSRFARQQVTVALGGDGSDELFAGYDPFLALRKAELYQRWIPRPVHIALRLLATHLPVSHRSISWDFKIKRTLRGLSYGPALWNPTWLGPLECHEIAEFFGTPISPEELYSEAIVAWDSCPQTDRVDRTLQFYTRFYLQDGILAKMDRASMLNSLEVRSPFLDRDVIDFARRLPNRFKLHQGTTKYLLKRVAQRLLPPSILNRKKKGFGSPIGEAFKQGILDLKSTHPFVRQRLAAHRKGSVDDRQFLWCQLVMERIGISTSIS